MKVKGQSKVIVTLEFFCYCLSKREKKKLGATSFEICVARSFILLYQINHTTYIRNNMCQKCEGNFGLWVLNEMIRKKYILKI